MKYFLSYFLAFFSLALFAQNDCTGYFPFQEGTLYELTSYDKKDKASTVTSYEVDFVTDKGEGFEAQVQTDIRDKKGESFSKGSFLVECYEDGFVMDLSQMMGPEMMGNYEGMEMKVSGDGIRFPHDMQVGQELPDAQTDINVSTSGIGMMSITIEVSNRKVEAEEKLTTPAGTFTCLKIRQTMHTKIMFGKREYEVSEWYAKGVGMVRQETYNTNGKLESWTELTRFEQN